MKNPTSLVTQHFSNSTKKNREVVAVFENVTTWGWEGPPPH